MSELRIVTVGVPVSDSVVALTEEPLVMLERDGKLQMTSWAAWAWPKASSSKAAMREVVNFMRENRRWGRRS